MTTKQLRYVVGVVDALQGDGYELMTKFWWDDRLEVHLYNFKLRRPYKVVLHHSHVYEFKKGELVNEQYVAP